MSFFWGTMFERSGVCVCVCVCMCVGLRNHYQVCVCVFSKVLIITRQNATVNKWIQLISRDEEAVNVIYGSEIEHIWYG